MLFDIALVVLEVGVGASRTKRPEGMRGSSAGSPPVSASCWPIFWVRSPKRISRIRIHTPKAGITRIATPMTFATGSSVDKNRTAWLKAISK